MKRPHRFIIEIEPAFTANTRYHFHNGNLRVDFREREHRIATPTLQQWSGFWRLCNFLDLWNWLPEYDDDGMSRDGQCWQLDIALDKSKRLQSKGLNMYPSLEDVTQPIDTMDRLALLLHFIDITLLNTSPDIRNDFTDYTN
jgi:hypothetical protein